MKDILHDEIDAVEDLREKAQDEVAKIRESLLDIASKAEGFEEILEAVAVLAEDKLADLTTEAVKVGARFAVEKAKKLG